MHTVDVYIDTESNCKMDSKDTTLAGSMACLLVSI